MNTTAGLASAAWDLPPTGRLLFGVGVVARLPDAVAEQGSTRAFVVTDPGLRSAGIADRVVDLLIAAGIETTVYDAVPPNPGTDAVDRAVEAVRGFGGGVVVALGGGSSLDAAKAIALLATNRGSCLDYVRGRLPTQPGLPVVAVPTTAGTGAETNGFGVFEDPEERRKVYLGDPTVRPRCSVLDPTLTTGLPPLATAATGMDALVHGIESLASRGSTPVSAAYATEAIRLVSGSLPIAVADGTDLEARAALLMGSHLAGLALSISGLGLVHGIAHAVTAHTGAVHGLALSAVLDEVMVRSLAVAQPAYVRVAEAMRVPGGRPGDGPGTAAAAADAGARSAVVAVRGLADSVRARLPLRELGLAEEHVPAVAAGALVDPVSRNHPRVFDADEVTEVLLSTR